MFDAGLESIGIRDVKQRGMIALILKCDIEEDEQNGIRGGLYSRFLVISLSTSTKPLVPSRAIVLA